MTHNATIFINVYPEFYNIPEQSQNLWALDNIPITIATCFKKLASQKKLTLKYPEKVLASRINNVIHKVQIEQMILFVVPKDVAFNWSRVKELINNQFPQINITKICSWDFEDNQIYAYLYIPVAINFEDISLNELPFTFLLEDALVQENIIVKNDSIIEGWIDQIFLLMLTENIIPSYITYQLIDSNLFSQINSFYVSINNQIMNTDVLSLSLDILEERLEQLESDVDDFFIEADNIDTPSFIENQYMRQIEFFNKDIESEPLIDTPEIDELITENDRQEIQESLDKIQKLLDKDAELEFKKQKKKKQSKLQEISNIPSHLQDSILKEEPILNISQLEYLEKQELLTYAKDDLIHQILYLQESLKRTSDSKSRLIIANERLEYQNQQLERQLMNYQIQRFEEAPVYQQRAKDWYKKIKIPLAEYDELIQKSKLLEHIWKINQQLIGTSEKMIIQDKDKIYAFEKVQQIKNSARDLELFVMMDECKNIQERVKIKKQFLFLPDRVIIQKRDYENLVEKATYYDMMYVENQVLERLLESSYEEEPQKRKNKDKKGIN